MSLNGHRWYQGAFATGGDIGDGAGEKLTYDVRMYADTAHARADLFCFLLNE